MADKLAAVCILYFVIATIGSAAGKYIPKGMNIMCGIVGWIDFEKSLRNEREVLTAMMETMAARGPP